MSRLNTRTPVAKTSPITTTGQVSRTHEGGKSYVNDAKGELFRLGVNLFAGEATFYEGSKARDKRFTDLVERLAVSDPKWTLGFLVWLRQEGNIRTAALMGAAHAAHARLKAGVSDPSDVMLGYNRAFISMVPQRADEPGEIAAYWTKKFGRTIPSAVKRGLADAANRLYNEYSFLKYDTDSHGWRFGDVIQMTHPKTDGFRNDLYRFAMTRRYGNEKDFDLSGLPMIAFNADLRARAAKDASVLLDPAALKNAGMTWEDALSLGGSRLDKAALWEALIMGGSIGHMAMLRNLRNFQEAGISKAAIAKVQADISNPEIVLRGRQFPFRYWAAYKNANGTQWAYPLEQALELSVQNIPVLNGQTDIYIDTSGSMAATMSDRGTIRRDEAAALFGVATALRNPGSRVFMYATTWKEVPVGKNASLMRTVAEIVRRNGEVGWGTNTAQAIRATTSKNTKRVVVFTDGQSMSDYYGGGVTNSVPDSVHMYAYDLAGYRTMDVPSGTGTRHQLAGLSDAAFKIMDLMERSHRADWPWEN